MEKTPQQTTNQSPSLLSSLGIIAICTSFGANAVAIKVSLAGLGVFTTAGFRFFLAACTIALWALATGRKLSVNWSQFKKLLVLSAIFTCQLGLFYSGLSRTYASRGTLIANLQPFFVLILAHFFIPEDRITIKKTIGIILGFTGVSIMLLEKKGISAELQSGDLLMLCAIFLWAINAIYTKTIIAGFKPFQLVLYPGIISVPFFLLAGYFCDGEMVGIINLEVGCALLYQSLVTASFGFVAWTHMLQKYGAVVLHSYLFILPVSGVLLGGLILDEPVTSIHIILALIFIVTGIIVINSDFSFVRRRLGW